MRPSLPAHRAAPHHEAVDLGVLELVYPPTAGSVIAELAFRHTATYRLNTEKLIPRMTWEQWQETCRSESRLFPAGSRS